MKLLATALLIAAVSLFILACGEDAAPEPTPPPTKAPTQAPTSAPNTQATVAAGIQATIEAESAIAASVRAATVSVGRQWKRNLPTRPRRRRQRPNQRQLPRRLPPRLNQRRRPYRLPTRPCLPPPLCLPRARREPPTATPEPAATPEPTAAPEPTNTPSPTPTPEPTDTPTPDTAPTRSPTPVSVGDKPERAFAYQQYGTIVNTDQKLRLRVQLVLWGDAVVKDIESHLDRYNIRQPRNHSFIMIRIQITNEGDGPGTYDALSRLKLVSATPDKNFFYELGDGKKCADEIRRPLKEGQIIDPDHDKKDDFDHTEQGHVCFVVKKKDARRRHSDRQRRHRRARSRLAILEAARSRLNRNTD